MHHLPHRQLIYWVTEMYTIAVKLNFISINRLEIDAGASLWIKCQIFEHVELKKVSVDSDSESLKAHS